jgi:hypothetical protein
VEKAKHESLLMEKLAELEEIDQSYKMNMSQLAGREGEFSKTIQRLEGENKRLQEALKHTMQSWTEESRKQQQKELGISKQSGDMAKSTSKALSKLSVAMEEIAQVMSLRLWTHRHDQDSSINSIHSTGYETLYAVHGPNSKSGAEPRDTED